MFDVDEIADVDKARGQATIEQRAYVMSECSARPEPPQQPGEAPNECRRNTTLLAERMDFHSAASEQWPGRAQRFGLALETDDGITPGQRLRETNREYFDAAGREPLNDLN
jgi:hypothetical protein